MNEYQIAGVLVVSFFLCMLTRKNKGQVTVIGKRKIVCLGDSNTWYPDESITPTASQWVSLLAARPEVTVINSGYPGRTSAYMLANFKTLVLDYAPDICIIEEGGNDALNGVTGDVTMNNIAQMVSLCIANHIQPWIMNCNPQQYSAAYVDARPSLAGKNRIWEGDSYLPLTRRLEKAFCDANGIPLIDIYTPLLNPDGTQNTFLNASENANISGAAESHVHMNAAGHAIVFGILKNLLGLG